MKDEKEELNELRRQKRKLEAALTDAELKTIALEALIECVEEHYEINVKKNFGQKALKKQSLESKS
jgi:hypothetical protein